jgi:hypothetical protein
MLQRSKPPVQPTERRVKEPWNVGCAFEVIQMADYQMAEMLYRMYSLPSIWHRHIFVHADPKSYLCMQRGIDAIKGTHGHAIRSPGSITLNHLRTSASSTLSKGKYRRSFTSFGPGRRQVTCARSSAKVQLTMKTTHQSHSSSWLLESGCKPNCKPL